MAKQLEKQLAKQLAKQGGSSKRSVCLHRFERTNHRRILDPSSVHACAFFALCSGERKKPQESSNSS